jgi:hypothetical protein
MKHRMFRCLMLTMLATATSLWAQQTVPAHTTEPPSMIEGPQVPGTPPAPRPEPSHDGALMNNDAVLRMHQAGLSDELIVQTIAAQPGSYQTGPDDLIALKKAGLADTILSAMALKSRKQITHTPVEAAPVEVVPVNEIGVYYKDDKGRWQPMESEKIHTRTSGFVKNIASQGIIKMDNNAVVPGPEAKLVLHRPTEFLIYTPDGVDGTEYDLLLFHLTGKDREFRILTGGIFHSTSGAMRNEVTFGPKRIAPHTWTFTLTRENVGGGEYGILPPGSGNITNGGKIYTFAFVE